MGVSPTVREGGEVKVNGHGERKALLQVSGRKDNYRRPCHALAKGVIRVERPVATHGERCYRGRREQYLVRRHHGLLH
jgi:hypothetical protein